MTTIATLLFQHSTQKERMLDLFAEVYLAAVVTISPRSKSYARLHDGMR